tara:strand:- start:147 stop:584 length:438 start_codon:yes stop_codon:yes gene_type:complete
MASKSSPKSSPSGKLPGATAGNSSLRKQNPKKRNQEIMEEQSFKDLSVLLPSYVNNCLRDQDNEISNLYKENFHLKEEIMRLKRDNLRLLLERDNLKTEISELSKKRKFNKEYDECNSEDDTVIEFKPNNNSNTPLSSSLSSSSQ